MTTKEATVFIIDVGRSMGRIGEDRKETDLDWAMQYVWDKITTTVAKERKTTLQAVVGLRTNETNNEMSGESEFKHISVFHELGLILLPDLKRLHEMIKLSRTNKGDPISALCIAISMITKVCKKLKYQREIFLITDGTGTYDMDQLPEIIQKLTEDAIKLTILGVDFDDEEYGYKEEDKDPEKAENEALLKSITDKCGGNFATLAEAITELGAPRVKETNPVASYKGQLTLGNPEKYDTALCIDVERYPKTMVRRPPTASNFVVRTFHNQTQESGQSSETILPDADPDLDLGDYSRVKNVRAYYVDDPTASTGRKEVDFEDLAKGYEYGRSAVPISESDLSVVKLETTAGLEIIGFVPAANFERYMLLSNSHIIVGQKNNSTAAMALSSLINALYELESYAVVRMVKKDDQSPTVNLLAPSIEAEFECLIEVQLPFAEDVRDYKFPPLDKVVTISGKILKEHRNLPTDQLNAAMSDYVDRMDLSAFGEDEEGNPAEYMPMADVYSPVLHRVQQQIRYRAVHSDGPIQDVPEILIKYSKPPTELIEAAAKSLKKLQAVADIKPVPPKTFSRKRRREAIKPSSGLDIEELLAKDRTNRKTIDPANAIPDFKYLLDHPEMGISIETIGSQFSAVIEKHITTSFGVQNYKRVQEEMRLLRTEMMAMEEPALWNEWARKVKRKMLDGEMGGDRKELWFQIRRAGLGLVDKDQSGKEVATAEECKSFLSAT